MSAIIVCPSAEEWPIIQRFIRECKEGAIVIPPAVAEAINKQFPDALQAAGVDTLQELYDCEWDFGGQADILIDAPYEEPTLARLADGTWVDHCDGVRAILNDLGQGPSE